MPKPLGARCGEGQVESGECLSNWDHGIVARSAHDLTLLVHTGHFDAGTYIGAKRNLEFPAGVCSRRTGLDERTGSALRRVRSGLYLGAGNDCACAGADASGDLEIATSVGLGRRARKECEQRSDKSRRSGRRENSARNNGLCQLWLLGPPSSRKVVTKGSAGCLGSYAASKPGISNAGLTASQSARLPPCDSMAPSQFAATTMRM